MLTGDPVEGLETDPAALRGVVRGAWTQYEIHDSHALPRVAAARAVRSSRGSRLTAEPFALTERGARVRPAHSPGATSSGIDTENLALPAVSLETGLGEREHVRGRQGVVRVGGRRQ